MKSCLVVFVLVISIPLTWFGYHSYKSDKICQNCQNNLNKYFLHLKSNAWYSSNCYVLDCFCDTKSVLKRVNRFRKILVAQDKIGITFLEKDIYETGKQEYKTIYYGGSADDINWEDVYKNIFVAGFVPEHSNSSRLKYMSFKRNEETFSIDNKQLNQLSKSLSKVVYNVNYDELNRSVLNQFAQTVFKDSTRFKYPTCQYNLYNQQNKIVEATMKYEDYGKGFYFEIW